MKIILLIEILFKKIFFYLGEKFFVFKRNKEFKLLNSTYPSYKNFLRILLDGKALGTKKFPFREKDLFYILEKYRPNKIIELGSGSSTFIFSDYVVKNLNSNLISVDDSSKWIDLTIQALYKTNLLPNERIRLIHSNLDKKSQGLSYEVKLPDDIDLIYIDGPHKIKNFGQPNQDIFKLFNRLIFPKLIAVDVRHKTLFEILKHKEINRYKFVPSTYFLSREKFNLLKIKYFGKLYFASLLIRKY